MIEPILVTRNFNHHITTNNQIMVVENELAWLQCIFGQSFFKTKNWENSRKFWFEISIQPNFLYFG